MGWSRVKQWATHPAVAFVAALYVPANGIAQPNGPGNWSMIGTLLNGRYYGTSCVFPLDVPAVVHPDGSWTVHRPDGTWPTSTFAASGEAILSCTEYQRGRGIWSVLWRDHTRRVRVTDGSGAIISLPPASMNALLDAAESVWPGLYPPSSRAFDLSGGGVVSEFQWSGLLNDSTVVAALGMVVGGLVRQVCRRRRFPSGHCQRCGYNLDGLPEQRCPECGQDAAGGAVVNHRS
jgi:hypothetical protein